MNVLSLFDGMSCGQIALNKIGIKYDRYFASEIDKYAIEVTQYNYPDTIQLGDIIGLRGSDLPKIDLLMGGSPCQGFSFAGKRLNFDDPRSKLFFEFVRLVQECEPTYFLLENVKMKKEYENVITKHMGIEPILINSALVSAQNRKRLYWTNISNVTQPENRGILLKHIIEDGFVDRDKSYCIDANYGKGGNLKRYFTRSSRQLVFSKEFQRRVIGFDLSKKHYKAFMKNYDWKYSIMDGKAKTLLASYYKQPPYGPYIKSADSESGFRKLTPLECERLQTIPDNYTLVPFGNRMMSNTQRYKMLGNGYTVDVIVHILEGLPIE